MQQKTIDLSKDFDKVTNEAEYIGMLLAMIKLGENIPSKNRTFINLVKSLKVVKQNYFNARGES